MKILDRAKRKVVFHESKNSFRGDVSFGKKYWDTLGVSSEMEESRNVNVILCEDYIIISKKELSDDEVKKIDDKIIPVKFFDKTIKVIKEIIKKLNELVETLENHRENI